MKLMTARYPGRCAECAETIKPGDRIAYYGRGHVEHAACAEQSTEDAGHPGDEDGEDGREDGTPTAGELRADRESARRGVSVFRFSSGAVVTQNSRGRCEDAPCCGCCT